MRERGITTGWRELTLLVLVSSLPCVAFALLSPVALKPMSGKELTLDAIRGELDKQTNSFIEKLNPVVSGLKKVEGRLDTQQGTLDNLNKRIDDIEKGKVVKASAGKSQSYAGMAGKPPVPISPPVKDKEGLNKAFLAEEEKMKEPGYKMKRHRNADYSARMNASEEQRADYDAKWEYGYLCIGLFPCGTPADYDTAKGKLEAKGKPEEKEIEWEMIRAFLDEDMGMVENAVKNVRDEIEEWFFQGDTAFLKMYTREGVAQVRAWSNMMNRMAGERHVTRKLHIWCPAQIENRFFGLKNLEFHYRNLRRARDGKCMTRMVYREGTIWVQFKVRYEDEYEDIQEPETSKIAGVEYWRRTGHRRLNTRNRGRGNTIVRPAADAPIPKGRDRGQDEARTRGRGSYRGQRGRGVPGCKALAAPGAPGAGASGSSVNTNAVLDKAGQFSARRELFGDSATPKAGLSKRGRKPKTVSESVQGNTMKTYFGTEPKKRSRSARLQENEEDDDVSRSQRNKANPEASDTDTATDSDTMSEICGDIERIIKPGTELTAVRPSPTKSEMEQYKQLSRKLHKAGVLKVCDPSKFTGSMGQARMQERLKLKSIMDKEKKYLLAVKKKVDTNDLPKDYDEAEHHVNTALFAAERKKCLNKLSELGDKTLQTVHPDATLSSDSDSEVFTEESEGEEIEEIERN